MQGPAIEDDSSHYEIDHYGSLARELAKGVTLVDPRAPKYRTSSLDEYLRSEVQRSVQRIWMLRRIRRPLDGPMLTAAELRELGRALAKVAFTTTQAMAARELEAIEGEPPDLACAIKYHCASEACYLIGCFFGRPADHLNSSEGGRFGVVTRKLYEAVTGEIDANVSRACDHVRKNWRLYAPKV
jgi:hypothetical protein